MEHHIYNAISRLLSSGKKLVLARIIKRSGSTPRDIGTMCVITQDNELIGTVGGGLLEYKVQKKAMAMFDDLKSFIYKFSLSNDDLAKNGMICGGSADLYLEPLDPDNRQTLKIFNLIHDQLLNNMAVTLVTRIKPNLSALEQRNRLLVDENQNITGEIKDLDPDQIPLADHLPFQYLEPAQHHVPTPVFIERIRQNPRIFLFGAGHVSTCVAPLAKTVGFDITVIDDRPEFANTDQFPDADEVLVSDFSDAFKKLAIGSNAFVLIITRGHLHDKTVLEESLKTPAAYIGMIGSMKKRNTIYRHLIENGVSQERLEQVYSPIGLDINAQTPEEIAVSIVAELIKVRAPDTKNKKIIL